MHLFVSPEETGNRLDKFLSLHFPSYSRTYFQYLIENQAVLVNGIPIKKREKVKEGDEVEVCFLLTQQLHAEPEAIPLDILYEDAIILAINKPANFVVHPAPGSPSGTFVNALLFHCQTLQKESFNSLRPGIVHRLDKDTTGVLLAAKSYEAHQHLIQQFTARTIEKRYLAICLGSPKEGLFSAPIKRHPIHRQQMTVHSEGKQALTQIKVLSHNKELSLVEVSLLTGRTHQIRVHLKHLGSPLLGDPVYGSQSSNHRYRTYRQLLHATSLTFTHPITHQPLTITAPLPPDMQKFIAEIEGASVNLKLQ